MTTAKIKAKTAYEYEGQRALSEILFNSIGDGAVSTDEFGRITRINPTAQYILGYSEKEAVGMWFPKLFAAFDDSGKSIPLIERPVTRAFVSGSIISEKIRYKTKQGNLVPIAMTISPIMVKNQPVGCIEIFRDITREYEIDKMKSDFISLASHQLRTPLSAIKTYAHMLLDGFMGPLSRPQIKALKTIVTSSNRMNETISTLLNITRIESGNIAVARKPFLVNQLVEEVFNEHRLAADDKKIKLTINKTSEPIKIISDPVILKEVITNLISNAVKYTLIEGQVTATIKLDHRRVLLTVEDNGVGIPEESKEHIFSKFFRAENVLRQETSGTGLGLYLVKRLVSELGGDVWFDSVENKGTTFYVQLPLLPKTVRSSIKK